MKKPIKRVAVIHDLCGVGKAALTNIIPILSVMKIEVCPIPTMILSTHTGGFGKPEIITCDNFVKNSFKHYKEINIDFEGLIIGYLGNENNIDCVLDAIANINTKNSNLIFDPIFADNGHFYSNFNKKYSDALKKIIKYSTIITPNYTEACILCDEKIKEYADKNMILNLSRKLYSFGCKNVIITSLPLENANKIATSVYCGKEDKLHIIEKQRLENSYPGTGDAFCGLLMGYILTDLSLLESVKKACDFIGYCIEKSNEYNYSTKEGILLELCLEKLFKTQQFNQYNDKIIQ